MSKKRSLVVFQDKKIRRVWHNDEWFFSVVDIIKVLTDSPNPTTYWRVLKHRELQLVTICNAFKLPADDDKMRFTDCVNTEKAFRLIQSIPSKKAEPFKKWLAQVGYERIQEIENPELVQNRAKKYYELKGYPKEWIEKRIRGIAIRQELTDEWQARGIDEKREYAILTNEIAKATFGVDINEHKKIKNLDLRFKNQNLRDHMTDLELIFNMLGEKVTTEITKNKDAKDFKECSKAAKKGGDVAGKARIDAEKKIGKKIVSSDNYLEISERKKRMLKNGK